MPTPDPFELKLCQLYGNILLRERKTIDNFKIAWLEELRIKWRTLYPTHGWSRPFTTQEELWDILDEIKVKIMNMRKASTQGFPRLPR